MGLFNAEVTELGEVTYVRVNGIIDADARFPMPEGGTLVVANAAGVARLSSVGVRHWIAWLSRLKHRNMRVFITEMSPAMVSQLNQINNFAGHGEVVSFFEPYCCLACDLQSMTLVQMQMALETTPYKPPVRRCDSCDGVLEFDAIEEGYFAFLEGAKPPNVPAAVMKAIEDGSSNRQTQMRTGTSSFPSISSLVTSSLNLTGPHMPAVDRKTERSLSDSLNSHASRLAAGSRSSSASSSSSRAPIEESKSVPPIVYVVAGLLVVAFGLAAVLIFR